MDDALDALRRPAVDLDKKCMLDDGSFPTGFFDRTDEAVDDDFYSWPRLVTHIDDGAIAAVGALYEELALTGAVLDLMGSWVSHFRHAPAHLTVLGMNGEELAANPQASATVVHDLNRDPHLPFEDAAFDAAVCCVSVDYLTQPVAVFADVRRVSCGLVASSCARSRTNIVDRVKAMQTRAGRTGRTEVRRVGIYVRISKDRVNEVSTVVQESSAAADATERDWQIIDTYTDRGRSAFKANVRRLEHDRALDDLEAGAIDTLLVYRLDRLSRSAADFGAVWRRIENAGGEFVSVSDSFDTTTAMGKAMVQIAMVFAELESGIKSERITDWHEHRVAAGSRRPDRGRSATGPAVSSSTSRPTSSATPPARVIGGEGLRSIVTDWNGREIRTANGRPWSNRALRHVLDESAYRGAAPHR